MLSALKDLTRNHNFKDFKIKDSDYHTDEIWNEFDPKFIEAHPKGKGWRRGEYLYTSDGISLDFIVYRPKDNYGPRVTYFRVEPNKADSPDEK